MRGVTARPMKFINSVRAICWKGTPILVEMITHPSLRNKAWKNVFVIKDLIVEYNIFKVQMVLSIETDLRSGTAMKHIQVTNGTNNQERVQGAAPKSEEELKSSQTRRSSQPRPWSSATELGPPSTALHTLRAAIGPLTHGNGCPAGLWRKT